MQTHLNNTKRMKERQLRKTLTKNHPAEDKKPTEIKILNMNGTVMIIVKIIIILNGLRTKNRMITVTEAKEIVIGQIEKDIEIIMKNIERTIEAVAKTL